MQDLANSADIKIIQLIGDAKSAYHWQTNTIILSEFTVECLGGAVADILEDESLAVDQFFYLIPDDNE
ncbi:MULTISPECIES: hypothetical protein [Acinetobacter]|nr:MULTISPECIES: hypothetical protein [Acinetobacter]MDI1224909.1 hypothetical protein [Acinetobacter sp.]MDO6643499.1 hypothetical protein [Acinetobacter guillouiae]